MKNLVALTIFALAIIASGYSEESSGGENSFMSVFNRFKRLLTSGGGEAVKPNRYVEIDFGDNGEKPAVKIVRLDAMEKTNGESRGERLVKAPIVRASRHEVPKPEAVQKELELGFIGPVVMNVEETKKTLKGSQYPGEWHDHDDDDYYDDDDHEDDYYDDDDDDDDDYFPRDVAAGRDPSVFSMSRKLAEMQKKRAQQKKPKSEESNEDDDDDEKNFAETHHQNSGEVYYHYRHHSHVYDDDDFKCPESHNGVYINLNHCRRYYICRAGRKTIVACHHGFSFDTRSRRCLPESISRC